MIKFFYIFVIINFWYYEICRIRSNDKVVASVNEGNIIEMYNQELTQVMGVIKELTNEIEGLNSQVEAL